MAGHPDFPISIDQTIGSSVSIEELHADHSGLYWIESMPDQLGRRTVLCMPDPTDASQVVDCTPDAKARARLHSYGGGAFAVFDGWLAWVDDTTSAVWVRRPDGASYQLTGSAEQRFFGGLGLFAWDGTPEPLLLAVREQAADIEHSLTQLVAVTLADGVLHVLDVPAPFEAADFVACPVLRTDGLLAWTQWNQPAMAWDSSILLAAQLTRTDDQLRLTEPRLIAGDSSATLDGVGVQRPSWTNDGQLRYLSDADGCYQIYAWDPENEQITQLTQDPYDHDLPQWTAENLSYANLPDGELIAYRFVAGRAELCRHRPPEFVAEPLAQVSDVRALSAHGSDVFALVELPDRPAEMWRLGQAAEPVVLRHCGPAPAPESLTLPRPLWTATPRGDVHSWFYPPHSTATRGSAPLLVVVHGGPTDMRTDALNLGTQFWTQRGVAVLDVNYAGSSGFGRDYRNRLRAAWGIADVDDVLRATAHTIETEDVDPARVALVGSSAGGFTVLAALTNSDRYAAGISKYGIADLTKLVGGPKFEARYLDALVGAWPATEQRYRDRSPLNHVDQMTSPLLILQGSADPIVPLTQATTMAEAAEKAGVTVELVVYDGEEHGFRSPEARHDALVQQAAFLSRVFQMQLG